MRETGFNQKRISKRDLVERVLSGQRRVNLASQGSQA